MRAMGVMTYGGPEELKKLDVPRPDVDENSVLVRVKAAGVGVWDAMAREGTFGKGTLPHVLGVECAGVIERIGAHVTDFHVGDDVYAYFHGSGAWADFAAIHHQHIAHKPKSVNYARAASLPVAAITADQALRDALALQPGEKIVIAGASGGVGTIAVQVAKAIGAFVIATTSKANEAYVRELGADDVIDYTLGDPAQLFREKYPDGVDAALDAVGGASSKTTIKMVRSGGRIAELTGEQLSGDPTIAVHFVGSQPSGSRLEAIGALIDAGTIRAEVARTYPLEEAKAALELVERRHVRGKVVLTI